MAKHPESDKAQKELMQTTAGDWERERCSRHWNLAEGMGVMCFILFALWGVAYPFGVMAGSATAKILSEVMLGLGAAFILLAAPWLHKDTASSWGLGSPGALRRLLFESSPVKRALFVLLILLLFIGLNYINYQQWPRVVKFFNLHKTAMAGWNTSFPGIIGLFLFGGLLSSVIVIVCIRYDNFLSAFGTAMKIALPLFALIVLGALVQRGRHAFDHFTWNAFFTGVFGYVFWGFVQQLLFSAYLGTRLRKAFAPTKNEGSATASGTKIVAGALIASLSFSLLLYIVITNSNGTVLPWQVIPGLTLFLFPLSTLYLRFYFKDKKRMLVATLTGSCFGMIHINSYGLVAVTFLLGIFLSYVFMEERNRNLVALGFIHGLLGSSFSQFFSKGRAGALNVDYGVGPWNVDNPGWETLIFPALCLLFYGGIIVWYFRSASFHETETPRNLLS